MLCQHERYRRFPRYRTPPPIAHWVAQLHRRLANQRVRRADSSLVVRAVPSATRARRPLPTLVLPLLAPIVALAPRYLRLVDGSRAYRPRRGSIVLQARTLHSTTITSTGSTTRTGSTESVATWPPNRSPIFASRRRVIGRSRTTISRGSGARDDVTAYTVLTCLTLDGLRQNAPSGTR
jgi:hypothetical protein